jgi:hypothetical protein
MAKHLMTSDHYFSSADLEAMSARIRSGQPLTFDSEQVATFVAMLEKHSSDLKGVGPYVFRVLGVLLGIVLLIGLILLALKG